jgi:hypothetical protein
LRLLPSGRCASSAFLDGNMLFIDLLAIHIVRDVETSTITTPNLHGARHPHGQTDIPACLLSIGVRILLRAFTPIMKYNHAMYVDVQYPS